MISPKIQVVVLGIIATVAIAGLTGAHEWMAPQKAGKIENPVPYGNESVNRGKELYLDNCAACHGENATGQKAKEIALSKDAPDLRKRLATHSGGDFFWKIQEGRGEMPSFKDDLEPTEVWDIINFLKTKN
ncbi:c-type cytochrome [Desulfopila sp. IMCC35008]|uniref:c-type cytochrome n=1 Tax=Desulfopila sp. IMCC35008 TaxID=2653858 RepID=UPI0013D8C9E2|nr:c-type cytochrome [Desulfopila sp. IMCC35008]